MMQITSLQHPLVKHWVSLRKEKEYRQKSQTLLLVGEKMVKECPHPLKYCIASRPTSFLAETSCLVTPEIAQKISGLEHFDGVIGEAPLPQPQSLEDAKWVLILDEVQDPGNVGTLLRAALALGWEGVMATPGTADLFNDKTLRASQGALFRLPFSLQSPEEIKAWVQRKKIALWVADASGKPLQETSFQTPLALVLSHEGQGARPWTQLCGQSLAIPLQNNVESLNVAMAGSILLYELKTS